MLHGVIGKAVNHHAFMMGARTARHSTAQHDTSGTEADVVHGRCSCGPTPPHPTKSSRSNGAHLSAQTRSRRGINSTKLRPVKRRGQTAPTGPSGSSRDERQKKTKRRVRKIERRPWRCSFFFLLLALLSPTCCFPSPPIPISATSSRLMRER